LASAIASSSVSNGTSGATGPPANAPPLPQQPKAAEQVRLDAEQVKPEHVARRIEAAKFNRGHLRACSPTTLRINQRGSFIRNALAVFPLPASRPACHRIAPGR